MKIKNGLIYIKGYWIGINKGCLDNDIIIGRPGNGGIKITDFILKIIKKNCKYNRS